MIKFENKLRPDTKDFFKLIQPQMNNELKSLLDKIEKLDISFIDTNNSLQEEINEVCIES